MTYKYLKTTNKFVSKLKITVIFVSFHFKCDYYHCFRYKGKQYIVLNCGGHWAGRPPRGNFFVAFHVPSEYISTTQQSLTSKLSATTGGASSSNILLSSDLSLIIFFIMVLII